MNTSAENKNQTLPLAIATIPMQPWEMPYDPTKSLERGTIFPSLDKPFFVTGGDSDGR